MKTFPVDKFGAIYYGPRTKAQAIEQLRERWRDCISVNERAAATNEVLAMLRVAGFAGVANRVEKEIK